MPDIRSSGCRRLRWSDGRLWAQSESRAASPLGHAHLAAVERADPGA